MRQFAGFGTPEDTNARYKALLAAGGTGLSVAFDLPTLMGRDPITSSRSAKSASAA
jgi:methylmalonyl-CoA mutase N-terminal domain/subunit